MTAPFHYRCPAPLSARGFGLRPEGPTDRPFLLALYTALRWPEFAALPWDDAAKRALLESQFDLQHRHYAAYPDPLFLILENGAEPAGRFYLAAEEGRLRLVEIALAVHHRGRGIGTALIRGLIDQAADQGQGVSLHVEKSNPAQNLYRRLGFRITGDIEIGWRMDRDAPDHRRHGQSG